MIRYVIWIEPSQRVGMCLETSWFTKSLELVVVVEVTWGSAQVACERLEARSMIAKGHDHLTEFGANEVFAVGVDVGGGTEFGIVESVPTE